VVQHAVDAEADEALVPARLDVDVAGALVEGVLQQPVDDVDDVGVVGLGALQRAELEHLLEVGDVADFQPGLARLRDRPRHGVELEHVAVQVRRIRHHATDAPPAQGLGEHGLPLVHERLAAGDHHLVVADLHGEDVVALGEGVAHHLGDGVDVDLQRVDAQVRLTADPAQPVGEGFEVERLARGVAVLELPGGDDLQRMLASSFLVRGAISTSSAWR
jgi:hypothetical protein